jgi:hypothetical protein
VRTRKPSTQRSEDDNSWENNDGDDDGDDDDDSNTNDSWGAAYRKKSSGGSSPKRVCIAGPRSASKTAAAQELSIKKSVTGFNSGTGRKTLVPLVSRCDQPASTSRSSGSDANSGQVAECLRTIQDLLATVTQPSSLFAQHIANELEQITDVGQRKRCMLDIQKVIVAYQTTTDHSQGVRVDVS